MTEQEFLRAVDQQVFLVKRLLDSPSTQIRSIVLDYIRRLSGGQIIPDDEVRSMIARIVKIGAEMSRLWTGFSASVIKGAHRFGAETAMQVLRTAGLTTHRGVDTNALGPLLSDMVQDFTAAQKNGERAIATFFKLSQQGIVSESTISEAVAAGLIREGGKDSTDLFLRLRNVLRSDATVRSDQMKLLAQLAEQRGRGFAATQVMLSDYRAAIMQGKILLITNKNGDVMRYQTHTYAELVARSRIADAQIQGTIDQGEAVDVNTFMVTDHNTTTRICKKHEGKTYTTNRSNKKFPYLTRERRPIYHPNCRHRLLVRVLTKRELASLPDYTEE